jgi:phospholipid/cholesterol/gamma-HCH transport system permease protein
MALRAQAERVTAAEILAHTPLYAQLQSAGELGSLAVQTLRTAITPPYPWLRDAVVEVSIALRRCLIPLFVSVSIYLLGFAVVIFGRVLLTIGVADREPGGMFIAFSREVCTWITMMVFAGIAGSAITADVGARKIREELDALDVLGVGRVRALVVPRVVATTIAAMALTLLSLLCSQVVNYASAPPHLGFAPQVFLDNVRHNILPADLYASLIKHAVLGFFVGLVACHKGLTSKGGAEGVGRAVNQTVVIAFFGIWAFNSIFQLAYLTLFPDASVLRG